MALQFLRSLGIRSNRPLGGHYKIIQELGEGGFGHTFIAQDLHLPGQPVCVIKQLKPHVDSKQALQVARRLFDTEAKVLYALGTHPHIPQLLAHFEDGNEFYLAQELVKGHSMAEEFTTTRRWTDAQVVAFLGDVLSTLSVVHQQRVIHRDLKPSNLIRRQRDQRIVLIDFGAVKQASTQLINSETGISHTISIGTQGYMPNEQIAGMPQFSSDLYAVGIMGIQLLTGRHPRTLMPEPTTGELAWHDYAPQTHTALVAFLDKMVRYDFRARYATATDALAALQSLPSELVKAIPAPIPLSNGAILANAAQANLDPDANRDSTLKPTPMSEPTPTSEPTLNVAPSASPKPLSPIPPNPSVPSMEQARTQAVLPLADQPSAPGLNRTVTETAGTTELATVTQPNRGDASHYLNHLGKHLGLLPAAIAVLGALSLGLALGRSGVSPPAATIAQPNTVASSERNQGRDRATEEGGQTQPANPQAANREGDTSPLTSHPAQDSTAHQSANPPEGQEKNSPAQTSSALSSKASGQRSTTQNIPALAQQLQTAEQLREDQQYGNALASYDEAIAHYPDSAEAHAGRCYSLNFLQRYDEAIEACDEAIDLDKENAHALWSKGYALEQQQDYKDALKLYDKAIKQEPGFAEAWNNKGTALLKLDKIRDAVKAFDEAIALDPNLSAVWSNRGAALWGLREFRLALESVEQALVLDPNNADAQQLKQAMLRGRDD